MSEVTWAETAPTSPPVPRIKMGEVARKLLHMWGGTCAFLIRILTPERMVMLAVAVLILNWVIMPPLGGRVFWRKNEKTRGVPIGILLYCFSLIALTLIFFQHKWMAATIWGILAFGDGAATIAGRVLGGPRLPWNANKGWAGSITFFVFASVSSVALISWTKRVPYPSVILLGIAIALVCAIVESLPLKLDDNVTVPLAGAIALPLLAIVMISG